jgi:hypothetical protein
VVCAFLFIILGSRYFELSIDVLREIFMERKGVGAITGVTLILSVPFYLCQLYASLVMGYTWKLRSEKMNRDVLSVIVFAIIYLIQQVIGVVILIAFAGAKVGAAYVSDTESFEISLNVLLGDNSTVSYQRIMDAVFEILAISLACSIIVAVVLATLSIYKMKRSLDLQ